MNKNDTINFLSHLKGSCQSTLIKYNFSEIITSLFQQRFDKIQPYIPASLAALYDRIGVDDGFEKKELCRKIVIMECLLNSWDEILSKKYPISIQDQFIKTSERIISMCESAEGWSEHKDDVYWKDLAIARQQIYPAGPGIVEVYSGFGFRQGFSIDLIQSFRFLKLLISSGRKVYYQIHTHTPLLSEFNEFGWNACYIRIADMLKKYENIKGVFRCSWFCDPQIKNISPRLTYLQKIPLENGAESFYAGEDMSGNAFAKSETRVKLYKQGKYKPKLYLLVWPREKLIRWAKSMRGRGDNI